MEIFSTFHARVKYISSEQYVIPLLKTGLSAHTQTHRQTKVKTVYPPVSPHSLGGYNNVLYSCY